MPPSELIKKPTRFKGTPEMKEVAENECWDEFAAIVDSLQDMTAIELIAFHSDWYMKVGHVNLCRFYMAALKAQAQANVESA